MTTSTVKDREQALLKRLMSLDIAKVVQPNKVPPDAKPLLVPEYIVVSSDNVGLAPGGKFHRAIFVVKVVTDLDTFSEDAADLAQQVLNGFPFGLTLDCGGDKMRISSEPTAQSAYRTDASWCLPVSVPVMVTGK
jgi:Bacteriophage related domain of unknown function